MCGTPILGAVHVDQVRKLRSERMPWKVIAKKLYVDTTTLWRFRKKHGIGNDHKIITIGKRNRRRKSE